MYCGLTSQGQLIAVKQVILDSSDADAANKEYSRLQGEVELLKTLRHINIVGFLGTSLQQHVVSIFMEYIPGGSIASIIHRLVWNILSVFEPQSYHFWQNNCSSQEPRVQVIIWCPQIWSTARASPGSVHSTDPGRGGLPSREQGDSSRLEGKQCHANANWCHQTHRLWMRTSSKLYASHNLQQCRPAQVCPWHALLDGTRGTLEFSH